MLRRQVQIATMNRSDSTTPPSGNRRTGPCTITGPEATTRTVRAWVRSRLFRPDHHEFFLTPAGFQPAGVLQPRRPRRQHGPNGIHWYATISASSPASASAASVWAGHRELDCTTRKVPPGASRSGTAADSGSVRGGSRSQHPMRVPTRCPMLSVHKRCQDRVGHRRIADHQVDGPNSAARAHEPRCTSTSTPALEAFLRATPDGLRTHIERRDLATLPVRPRRSPPRHCRYTSRLPDAERQPGLVHHVDQESGVFLRGVDARRRDDLRESV